MANGDDGFDTGNPAGFIRSAIFGESNQSEAYDLFHSFGGHMQESRFNQLYQNVSDTMARESESLGLDPFQVPGPAAYSEWATKTPGLYATQVELQVFDKELENEQGKMGAWITMQTTYVTAVPHTPAEAEQWADDTFNPENTGTNANQVVYGGVAIHFWKTVPLA